MKLSHDVLVGFTAQEKQYRPDETATRHLHCRPLLCCLGHARPGRERRKKLISKGSFTWDREVGKGSARAASVANGCFIQSYAVQPRECYIIKAMRRLQGRGECSTRARWQTPEGKWTAETQDKIFFCEGSRDQWSEIIGVVTVPQGAGKLVLLLVVKGQESADDVAWFDDVEAFRIVSVLSRKHVCVPGGRFGGRFGDMADWCVS